MQPVTAAELPAGLRLLSADADIAMFERSNRRREGMLLPAMRWRAPVSPLAFAASATTP
ncbi:hypothetical protein [Pseudooceanicola sp.]|uniref:hypothetical protein n=1 Tax=Pseudooceanicola sp. TaxID=1914328 RepID=UPI002636CEB3|nr:hypothetical protein [Pseudooceanicola sp.]